MGRNAFDGLLQRRAPEALLGRAGARYETRFQLAWVFGGLLATAIILPVEVNMILLTAIYVPALVIFVRGIREAHRFEGPPDDHLGGAHVRLAMAQQAFAAGSLRVAIVEASAAVDLAQSVVGAGIGVDERRELDALRCAAIDVDQAIGEPQATEALRLAEGMIRAALPR
jgi:hypothetical protein